MDSALCSWCEDSCSLEDFLSALNRHGHFIATVPQACGWLHDRLTDTDRVQNDLLRTKTLCFERLFSRKTHSGLQSPTEKEVKALCRTLMSLVLNEHADLGTMIHALVDSGDMDVLQLLCSTRQSDAVISAIGSFWFALWISDGRSASSTMKTKIRYLAQLQGEKVIVHMALNEFIQYLAGDDESDVYIAFDELTVSLETVQSIDALRRSKQYVREAKQDLQKHVAAADSEDRQSESETAAQLSRLDGVASVLETRIRQLNAFDSTRDADFQALRATLNREYGLTVRRSTRERRNRHDAEAMRQMLLEEDLEDEVPMAEEASSSDVDSVVEFDENPEDGASPKAPSSETESESAESEFVSQTQTSSQSTTRKRKYTAEESEADEKSDEEESDEDDARNIESDGDYHPESAESESGSDEEEDEEEEDEASDQDDDSSSVTQFQFSFSQRGAKRQRISDQVVQVNVTTGSAEAGRSTITSQKAADAQQLLLFQKWRNDALKVTTNERDAIRAQELLDKYCKFAADQDAPRLRSKMFSSQLRKIPGVDRKRTKDGHWYQGLRWADQ